MKNNLHKPPKKAQLLLTWLIRDDLAEEVLGDLEEKFFTEAEKKSLFRAKLNYWYQVIHYLRPFAMRKRSGSPIRALTSNNITMFRYYFKISWRTLLKDKVYSFIKIGGFAIGIAACVLISLFIKDELSYDQHFPDKDRIYRVALRFDFRDMHGYQMHFQAPYARTLKDELPEIEQAGRINPSTLFGAGSNEVRRADSERSTHEKHVAYFDQELLEIFEPEMVEGSLKTALAEPNTIVISESKAEQYFPNGNALGKTLIFSEETENPYKIGGVMKDFPENSHLNYDFLITLTGREFGKGEQDNWYSTNYFTYVKLTPQADVDELMSKLEKSMIKYWAPIRKKLNVSEEEMSHRLQPVTDIHLYSEDMMDGLLHGDIRLVWLFRGIAGFILLLACINFVNLSTAKSANRAKEVGLKKTLGSSRKSLVNQFLTESTMYSLISFAVGLMLAWMVLPYFNMISGKSLSMPWLEWWLVPSILIMAVIIGVVAGFYPSFYLSSFRPIQVLKGNLSRGSKNAILRSSLVVFQFVTSIVLVIGTLVINQQMNFILNSNVGFEKDQVILLQGANTMGDDIENFKSELLTISGVENVSVSDFLPITSTDVKRNGNTFWKFGAKDTENGVPAQFWRVDKDYVQTMGMHIVKGRDFAAEPANDRNKVIVNETLVKRLGLVEPVGSVIDNGQRLEIIGVVEDFHFQSFKEDVGGLVMAIGKSPSVVAIKAKATDMSRLLQSITNVWDEFQPNQAVRYSFLDEEYERMYADVKQSEDIFRSFSILAIIVACLGLFGLSAYMAEQRSKEISIRKVLGASVGNILHLLTFNILKLVGIAFVIAVPIAAYFMQNWLNDFEYRIDLAWWVFALAGLIAGFIALITIFRQALKVAFSNPVDYLRSE